MRNPNSRKTISNLNIEKGEKKTQQEFQKNKPIWSPSLKYFRYKEPTLQILQTHFLNSTSPRNPHGNFIGFSGCRRQSRAPVQVEKQSCKAITNGTREGYFSLLVFWSGLVCLCVSVCMWVLCRCREGRRGICITENVLDCTRGVWEWFVSCTFEEPKEKKGNKKNLPIL